MRVGTRSIVASLMRWAGTTALLGMLGGCAVAARVLDTGTEPPDLVGRWVDVARATPTDTVVWVFPANGWERTLTIRVATDPRGRVLVKQHEVADDRHWQVNGQMADTAGRRLCFRQRFRGKWCYRFRLDSIAASGEASAPRRLVLLPDRKDTAVPVSVLVERLPRVTAGSTRNAAVANPSR